MHVLTLDLANIGDHIYVAIPTYFNPSNYLHAKCYVEYVYHHPQHTFYHVMVEELIEPPIINIRKLSGSYFRMIHRQNKKLQLVPTNMPMYFSNDQILVHLQRMQRDFVIDIPAPFASKTLEGFKELCKHINQFYRTMDFNTRCHVE